MIIVPGDYVKISNGDSDFDTNISCVYFIQQKCDQDGENIVALFAGETMSGTVIAVTNWSSFDEGFRLDVHNEIGQYIDEGDSDDISLTPQTKAYVIVVNEVCKSIGEQGEQFQNTIVVVPHSSRFVSVTVMQRDDVS